MNEAQKWWAKKCSRIFYEKVGTVQITNLNMEYPNKETIVKTWC